MSHQPESSRKLSSAEFNRIRENLKYRKKASSLQEETKRYLPLDMGLFLTARCNLRCKHCFEWSEDGFLTNGSASCAMQELPIEKLRECLAYTKPAHTRLYLWGGEPLLYSHFSELCQLLKEDPRWTTICTNGLLIEKRLDDILPISEQVVMLISLDGFEDCNDAIRGKGTFQRVIESIRTLRRLAKEGLYKGEVSVCCVINPDMIGRLYEFCEFMETLDINTLYLSYPWYISEETARQMDSVFEQRFGDLIHVEDYSRASWHSFTFHIPMDKAQELKEDIQRITERRWNIRVRFQPAVEPDEIDDFISGGTRSAQQRTRCLVPFNRIDILQNGDVSACKLFREFTVGNICEQPIGDIWEGSRMEELRKRLQCGLMPVCSKCVLLYLNGE